MSAIRDLQITKVCFNEMMYLIHLFFAKMYEQEMLGNFLKLYYEDRPAFDSVEGLLISVDLYNNTQYTIEELLLQAGLSRLLIDELVTVSHM